MLSLCINAIYSVCAFVLGCYKMPVTPFSRDTDPLWLCIQQTLLFATVYSSDTELLWLRVHEIQNVCHCVHEIQNVCHCVQEIQNVCHCVFRRSRTLTQTSAELRTSSWRSPESTRWPPWQRCGANDAPPRCRTRGRCLKRYGSLLSTVNMWIT